MSSRIAADASCRSLLDVLWLNYVLFAVLTPGGAYRRILKYEYTEDVGPREAATLRERLSVGDMLFRVWHPRGAPKFRRSGAYVIESADGCSQSVEPGPAGPPAPPVKPTDADKALVAALRARHSA